MTSPGTQRTAGQLRGRSDRKQGGRSAAFFRELIGRRKICGGCLITPRSPEKIPNPSSRALLRVSAAQMMVVAPGWVRFVHGITWISKNCGPIKGKERGKTSRHFCLIFWGNFLGKRRSAKVRRETRGGVRAKTVRSEGVGKARSEVGSI